MSIYDRILPAYTGKEYGDLTKAPDCGPRCNIMTGKVFRCPDCGKRLGKCLDHDVICPHFCKRKEPK